MCVVGTQGGLVVACIQTGGSSSAGGSSNAMERVTDGSLPPKNRREGLCETCALSIRGHSLLSSTQTVSPHEHATLTPYALCTCLRTCLKPCVSLAKRKGTHACHDTMHKGRTDGVPTRHSVKKRWVQSSHHCALGRREPALLVESGRRLARVFVCSRPNCCLGWSVLEGCCPSRRVPKDYPMEGHLPA